jgi:phage shock protein E
MQRRPLLSLLGLALAARATPPTPVPKPVIIDVRTRDEWDAGHIEGAVHIPLDEIAARIGKAVPAKETPVTLYCRSGRRSGLAKQELEKLGYQKVENAGGFEAFREKLKKAAPPR